MSTWTTSQEWLAEEFPGYEDRAEQTNLALAIEGALANNDQLLAQAGCGTGKSFAALISAIFWALDNNDTVIYSTATKALQTQLALKDMPFLAALFARHGRPFTWSVVKGRGGYLCLSKLSELNTGELVGLDSLRQELEADENHTGDLDDLLTELDLRNDRSKVTSTGDECVGRNECPFGERCFAEKAKAKAAGAHIVIVNHAFLMVDALVRETGRGSLLPDFGAVILDEGHEVEDYATGALGNEFTERQLMRFGSDVARWLDAPEAVGRYTGLVKDLFENVLPAVLRNGGQREKKSVKLDLATIQKHVEVFAQLKESIEELSVAMSAVQVHGDDRKATARKRLKKRATTTAQRIYSVVTAESDQLVRWVAREDKVGIVLKYAPLHVAPFLRRAIWNTQPVLNDEGMVIAPARPRAVVVMSATLTTGNNDFSFIARTLGLDSYTGFDAGSPFDFAKQAALYVPKPRTKENPRGFANPADDKETWRAQVQAVTASLVKASGGRALLLYTSREGMEEAYDALAEGFEEEGLQVLVQNGRMSNRQIADEFRRDETSVLFALKSFMTGADFQGRTLQLVIMDKLPFAPQEDVIVKARGEAADAIVAEKYGKTIADAKWHKEGSFNGMTVPAAILTLMQAVGRGVRTRDDHALLVVLDPRLLFKNYGPRVLKALPPAKRLHNLPEAKAYLAGLDELAG